MKIGEVADQSGVSTKTIRFYESIGVLPQPERSANGYRAYSDDTVDRLRFVRDAQATGLTLTEIASIIELRDHGAQTCEHVTLLLERHLAELDQHITALQRMRRQLASLTSRAQQLDPTNCTDPHRCQTITPAVAPLADVSAEIHHAPRRHDH